MKRLVSIGVALLFALPAAAQRPAWWTALHGSYLTAGELAQVTFPQATTAPVQQSVPITVPAVGAAVQAIAQPIAAAASDIAYLPKWYGSLGAGAVVPGSGKFAYEAIAAYIGAQTYATTVNEFNIVKGQVQSCAMGGLSKILYEFGPLSIGTTGLAGGCTATSTSGGAAGAVQPFLSWHIGHSGVSLLATGDKIFTVDGKQAAKITFGISYASK